MFICFCPKNLHATISLRFSRGSKLNQPCCLHLDLHRPGPKPGNVIKGFSKRIGEGVQRSIELVAWANNKFWKGCHGWCTNSESGAAILSHWTSCHFISHVVRQSMHTMEPVAYFSSSCTIVGLDMFPSRQPLLLLRGLRPWLMKALMMNSGIFWPVTAMNLGHILICCFV